MSEKEYVLGTGNDELERLSLQHRVWAGLAAQSWAAAGIGPGSQVLDLGCGPGYASYDLAQLVGSSGKVLAFDESKSFVDFVSSQSEARILPQLQARIGDAQNISKSLEPDEKFDAVYCRWVMCWLPKPQLAIEGIWKVLKPGGKLVIHDYFNWKAMCLAPRSEALEKTVLAAVSSFEDRNGNVDICSLLPSLLTKNNFEITKFSAEQKVARGGGKDSNIWWVLQWWRTYAPKLVELGKLSNLDCQKALKDLENLETNPDSFFVCPTVYEIIAQKPIGSNISKNDKW
jgi:SAM-dependent methyltransferase